jgi:hypothetical protein
MSEKASSKARPDVHFPPVQNGMDYLLSLDPQVAI